MIRIKKAKSFKSKNFILVSILICFLISVIYTMFFIDNIFSAESEFYVKGKLEDGITNGDIEASDMIKNDYLNVIKSDTVMNDVRKQIIGKYPKYNRISMDDIKKSIEVNTSQETRLVKIKVSSDNPNLAADVANIIVVVLKQKMMKMSNEEYINIVTFAKSSNIPDEPKPLYNIVTSTLVGISFSMMVIFLFELIFIKKVDNKNPLYY